MARKRSRGRKKATLCDVGKTHYSKPFCVFSTRDGTMLNCYKSQAEAKRACARVNRMEKWLKR